MSAKTLTDSGLNQGVLIRELDPLFPFPPLPYYLTLFKHYMAQQRVDRAVSYPPELIFLHQTENI